MSSLAIAVTPTSIGTCGSRTINYITHNLPQVCLRYSRSDSASLEPPYATVTEPAGTETTPNPSGTANSSAETDQSAEELGVPDLDADSALDESTFLSFEDWKKQTLEKEGLLDPSTGDRRPQPLKDGDRRRSTDGIQDALKALEEDVVIDTDFTAFLGGRHGDSAPTGSSGEDKPTRNMQQDAPDDKAADKNRRFRSKDAGKTCKERFNFASLDAGGQIMKTNPEAKSASSLLKEDRDVYMLNSCQAKNKFLIVELSESILVETVAIANFEFFSSTFRQFHVSVSDRYPVKLDRWVDLGTFEARNSRDIQAFLIEDPRIWARYLRVEFLSHYGNEFYCPVSLLRVHGRTMIQDVLSMEELTRGEDEIEDDVENLSEGNGETLVPDAIAEVLEEEHRVAESFREAEAALEELVKTAEAITSPKRKDPLDSSQIIEVKRWLENISIEQMTTPCINGELTLTTLFDMSRRMDICLPSDAPASRTMHSQEHSNETAFVDGSYQLQKSDASLNELNASSTPSGSLGIGIKDVTELDTISQAPISSLSHDFQGTGTISREPASSQTMSASSIAANWTATSSNKFSNKTSPTPSSHSSQPTTQESFFKTVTKRLQLLETNSTLSLKYIEEQSRILRDAFNKVEKRQLAKTTSFLGNLNDTVLQELRKFGQRYDQIWQSTFIELETQRDQSQREIAAVSTRLSMLADELVFQKRMSIVQSVLLLLCLALVIFSRSSAGGYLDVPIIQNMVARSRNASDLPVESALNSPAAHRTGPPLEGRAWLGPGHRRQRSDDSAGSLRPASRDYSPPTPFSTYSRQEEYPKPDMEHDDLLKGVRKRLMGATLLKQDIPRTIADSNSGNWQESGEGDYPDFKNSVLWLTGDPDISGSSRVQPYENALADDEEQNPTYETYRSGNLGAMNSNVDGLRTGLVRGSPHLPLPPSERDRPEFSIARKPLPALPKDD